MAEFLSGSAVWGVVLTIGAFAIGTAANKKTGRGWCSPLLLGSILIILVLTFCRVPYTQYKTSASPLSYLLLPATVSLAIPLYEKRALLRQNFLAIAAGVFSGVLVSLASLLLLARLLGLDAAQAATLLPKSVTTAIGMDISAALGGMPPLTGAVIILTGITGSLTAQWLCKAIGITDPVAKGIGIGSASHAIGTTKALEIGETEGAMSSLATALAGVLTAILAPICGPGFCRLRNRNYHLFQQSTNFIAAKCPGDNPRCTSKRGGKEW